MDIQSSYKGRPEYVLPGAPTGEEVMYLGDRLAQKYGSKESPRNENGLTAFGEMIMEQPEPKKPEPETKLSPIGEMLLAGVELPRLKVA